MSIVISESLRLQLDRHAPIVALESAVIATGLPFPHNLEAAYGCEDAILASGATPATIAILSGTPYIGCSREQIEDLAKRTGVQKTNLSNLSAVVTQGRYGATTVSTTMHLAASAGIRVFSTGGIGGVHRDAELSFDISSDLAALARYPMVVVCAGAKSILDLPRTMEVLETLGVPVIGYRTEELPAFHSRKSGIKLDIVAESAAEIARIARTHWDMGFSSGILVALPVPEAYEIAYDEVDALCRSALEEAARAGVRGKPMTPFMLSKLEELSAGRTVRTNVALLKNNASLAGEIAVCLA